MTGFVSTFVLFRDCRLLTEFPSNFWLIASLASYLPIDAEKEGDDRKKATVQIPLNKETAKSEMEALH